MEGLALPEGGDFLGDDLAVFLLYDEGAHVALGEFGHRHVEEVAVQLGVEDAITALAAGAAGQELVVVDVDRDLLGHVLEGLGPAQHEGLALRLAHGLREVLAALDVDLGGYGLDPVQNLEGPAVGLGGPMLVGAPGDLVLDQLLLGRKAAVHLVTS